MSWEPDSSPSSAAGYGAADEAVWETDNEASADAAADATEAAGEYTAGEAAGEDFGEVAGDPAVGPEFASLVAAFSRSRAWMTRTGTLGEQALGAIVAECSRLRLDLEDCGAEVKSRLHPFEAVPGDAAEEFSFLAGECAGKSDADCRREIYRKRALRALAIGTVDPQPRTMAEGDEVTFKAFVRRSNARHVPGSASFAPAENEPPPQTGPDGKPVDPHISYSRKICFQLDPGKSFKVLSEKKVCPAYMLSGSTVFAPEWRIVPIEAGEKRELKVMRFLTIGGVEEEQPQDPYPIYITVTPRPSLASRVKVWLTEWTGVAKEARNLVLAVEALFVAISSMALWRWLRGWLQRRRARREAEQGDGAGPSQPPPESPPPE